MKVSMILTSLIVAMSAMSLTACDKTAETEVSDQPADVIEQTEEMKNEVIDEITPAPTAE